MVARHPTCSNVKGYDVLAADTLQAGVRSWQLTEGAGGGPILWLVPSVGLPYHQLNLLLVLLRNLGPGKACKTAAFLGVHDRDLL
jgi:hypothetical protein